MSVSGIKRKPKGIAYYHCPNRTGCGKYWEMLNLEAEIAKEFLKFQFSDEFTELVIGKARKSFLAGREKYEGRRQGLLNRKTAFEQRLKSAEDKLLDGILSDDHFTAIRTETKEKIEKIEEEIVRLQNEREVDIDVVQGILLLSRDIYTAYTKASHDLKRQYLSFFWERFEVADGVILKSVSSPLFEQLLAAEDAFANRPKNENDASKASFSGVILTSSLLRGQDSNLRPIDYTFLLVTEKRGLYHHRFSMRGASNDTCRCTPLRDSLYTFRGIPPKAWLGIALACAIGVPRIHLVLRIGFLLQAAF